MYGSKHTDFQMAIEEAVLAEGGFVNTVTGSGPKTSPVMNHSEVEEATGSNLEQEFSSLDQVSSWNHMSLNYMLLQYLCIYFLFTCLSGCKLQEKRDALMR